MASTYVNDLRLNEMATGDESGNWGVVTNLNLELIGEALGYGTEGITTNANTHTTTVADGAADPGRAMYLEYTGTLDSACTITIAPNTVSRMHFIENGTSGSQNIIIKQGSGATITIPPGDTKAVYLDGAGSGAKVVDAFASLNVVDLKVQDDLTVTDDVAIGGLATVGGTLGVTGIVTLTDDLIIGDGKTIGSASDVDAMTIASNGQITLTQTLIGTALDISGDIDVDGVTNLDNTDIDGTLDVSGQATFADGSAGAPSISNTGDVNAGLFFSAADVMSFSAGGTAQFTMADGSISPVTDNDIDLGTASLKYKSFFAGLTDTENFKVNGGQGDDGQVLTSTGSGVAWEDAAGGGPTFKTFGTNSIMVGDNATGTIDAANNNTGLGVDIFTALTTGDSNSALGTFSLELLTTGTGNSSLGYKSLEAVTEGGYNTAMGWVAGYKITTGTQNVCIGGTAGDAITTASDNVAVGYNALGSDETGANNTAVGALAGFATTGSENTFLGYRAGKTTTSATTNIVVGSFALDNGAANTGGLNTVMGHSAARLITTGTRNTILGYGAGAAVTTGAGNILLGGTATGNSITTGSSNIAIGQNALPTLTASLYPNIAIGENALYSMATGYQNVAIGYTAGQSATGVGVTIVGDSAGFSVTSGNSNTCFGVAAGYSITTGANNLCLGPSAGQSNQPTTVITTQSNQIVVGNADHTNAHIQIDWTVASDKRDKTDVTPLDMGLSFINKLEPVTYKWDKRVKYEEGKTPDGTHKESWTDVGFLAQDVEKIEAEFGHKIEDETNLTTYMSEDKDAYGLTYAKFVPMLVKSVQELSTQVDELKQELATLKGE